MDVRNRVTPCSPPFSPQVRGPASEFYSNALQVRKVLILVRSPLNQDPVLVRLTPSFVTWFFSPSCLAHS
jgi:hypothetical protein